MINVGLKHIELVQLSGYAHNAAVGSGAALDAGMEILTKPFTLDALAKRIHSMIERI